MTGEEAVAQVHRRFRSMSGCPVLSEGHVVEGKVLGDPGKYHLLQNLVLVVLGIDFDSFFDKNERGLLRSTDSSLNHH